MKQADGVHRPCDLLTNRFEAIADAAMRAMFIVDGRIEPTASATYNDRGGDDAVVATRKFKAQFRRELTRANFRVWKGM